jgi:hypothetical protein
MATKPPFKTPVVGTPVLGKGGIGTPISAGPTPISAKPVTTPAKPTGSTTSPIDPFGGLSGSKRDAAVAIQNLFESYGIGSLAPTIIKFIQQGYSSDTISILLQQTDAYKQRFPANEARLKAGLPVLSPADYISTEDSYRQVMQSAGLPIGFYDKTSDFTNLLSKDVSPTEVQSRVSAVSEAINQAPPETVNYFKQFGYTNGDMISYALDPTVAQPLIDQRLKAAEAAAIAGNQGTNLSQSDAELIGQQGASLSSMQQGLGFVSQEGNITKGLDNIYGGNVTTDDLVKEAFTNDGAASAKVQKLASQQRGSFSGSSGQGKNTLSTTDAGSI